MRGVPRLRGGSMPARDGTRQSQQALVDFLTPRRAVFVRVYLAFSVCVIASALLTNLWAPRKLLIAISNSTAGIISPTLLLAPCVYLPMWLLLGKWGGLGLRDFDIRRRPMIVGAAATMTFWALMQVTQIGLAIRAGRAIELHGKLYDPGATFVVGRLISQLVATAPYEEMVFRRFAISQLMGYWERVRPAWLRVALVVLVTQLFFWVMHFPLALSKGVPGSALLAKTDIILVAGFLFTWMYLQTRNLWICVGYHALSNAPAPLVAESTNAHGLVRDLGIGLLLVHLAWLGVARWRAKPQAATPELH